ncbi:transposase (plasmid) [Rhodococcus sp. PSBB049]|nr:transposase [Rhodococcus sp. PSBB049]
MGLCPGHHESAGKRHCGARRKGNPQLQDVLVECGWAAVRTPGYLQSLDEFRAFTRLKPTRYAEVRRRFRHEHPGHRWTAGRCRPIDFL